MNDKKLFFKADKVGLVLTAAVLVTLTGCVGYVDGPSAGIYAAPPVVEVGVAVQDDYVYYPDYEIYYSSSRHQYAYREGNAWVSRPAPHGVSLDALRGSRSVRMDFHDSPEHHHSEVVKQYPKNGKPSGAHQGQKDDQKNNNRNQHDDRGGNNGR